MLPALPTIANSALSQKGQRVEFADVEKADAQAHAAPTQRPSGLDLNTAILGKLNLLLLSSDERMAQNFTILVEVFGRSLGLSRRENEANSAFARRIVETIATLPPSQRAAIEQQLGQLFNGLKLQTVIAAFENLSGPEAAALAIHLELPDQRDRDPATKSVVTTYRQNEAGETAGQAAARQPASTAVPAGQHPSSDPAGPSGDRQAATAPIDGSTPDTNDAAGTPARTSSGRTEPVIASSLRTVAIAALQHAAANDAAHLVPASQVDPDAVLAPASALAAGGDDGAVGDDGAFAPARLLASQTLAAASQSGEDGSRATSGAATSEAGHGTSGIRALRRRLQQHFTHPNTASAEVPLATDAAEAGRQADPGRSDHLALGGKGGATSSTGLRPDASDLSPELVIGRDAPSAAGVTRETGGLLPPAATAESDSLGKLLRASLFSAQPVDPADGAARTEAGENTLPLRSGDGRQDARPSGPPFDAAGANTVVEQRSDPATRTDGSVTPTTGQTGEYPAAMAAQIARNGVALPMVGYLFARDYEGETVKDELQYPFHQGGGGREEDDDDQGENGQNDDGQADDGQDLGSAAVDEPETAPAFLDRETAADSDRANDLYWRMAGWS